MKNRIVPILVLSAIMVVSSALGLAACRKKPNDNPYEVEGSLLKINKAGVAIYEAEEVNTSHYTISPENRTKIVTRSDASGGKFLAAAKDGEVGGGGNYFEFTVELSFNAQIIMSVAYSQTEGTKGNNIDMVNSYNYLIDDAKNLTITENNSILHARGNITDWELITYDKYTLSEGEHNFRVFVAQPTGLGNPNIDYLKFDVSEIKEEQVEIISVPENDFHNFLQYSYIHDNYQNIFNYTKAVIELSLPGAIKLDFSYLADAPSYVVQYADNAEFENPTIVERLTSKEYSIYNLKLGQELYWRAASSLTGLQSAQTNHITIASDGPRNLYIDGITNIRDIGGYGTSLIAGGVINQGLFIRGAHPDNLTNAGKAELVRLGIRTQIDLRDAEECKGPYVDGIAYNAISISSGTHTEKFGKYEIEYQQIFDLIEKADNSPVYLNSSSGTDRAGLCSFILLTVLGVSQEDVARDYLFSNFSYGGVRQLDGEFATWLNKLENYEGTTLADKAKSWLVSKGMTSQQVEHIREIFIDGYKAIDDGPVVQPTTPTLEVGEYKAYKFEAEEANLNDWLIENIHTSQTVKAGDKDRNGKEVAAANTASGGQFLAAPSSRQEDCNAGLYLEFKVNLKIKAKITLIALYVQSQDKLNRTPDLANNFTITLGDKALTLSGNTVMNAIADGDGSNWVAYTYDAITLEAGEYTFRLQVNYDPTGQGNPNIDYFEFVADDPASSGPIDPNPPKPNPPNTESSTVLMADYGTYTFEAENAEKANYIKSDEYRTTVVERADASGGKFLAAASAETVGKDENYLTFTINVVKDGKLTLSISLVQTESQKGNIQNISKTFGILIDGVTELTIPALTALQAREDTTEWELFSFDRIPLSAGTHEVKLYIKENTGNGVPNIDYFKLTLEEA